MDQFRISKLILVWKKDGQTGCMNSPQNFAHYLCLIKAIKWGNFSFICRGWKTQWTQIPAQWRNGSTWISQNEERKQMKHLPYCLEENGASPLYLCFIFILSCHNLFGPSKQATGSKDEWKAEKKVWQWRRIWR